MDRFMHKRLKATFILVLFTLCLLAVPVKADPGVTYMDAETIDAHAILVTWSDDPMAEGYLIYRMYHGYIAEVPEDINEYLDIGLNSHTHYGYQVESLIDGKIYYAQHPDVGEWTLDPPGEINSLSWYKLPKATSPDFLGIELSWTPMQDVESYEVFARIGDVGEYSKWAETTNSEAVAAFSAPVIGTRYWFKVRAIATYFSVEMNEYYLFDGPFGPPASISVPGDLSKMLKTQDLFDRLEYLSTPDPYQIVDPSIHKSFSTATPSPTPFKSFPKLIITKPPKLVMPTTKRFIPPIRQLKPIRP